MGRITFGECHGQICFLLTFLLFLFGASLGIAGQTHIAELSSEVVWYLSDAEMIRREPIGAIQPSDARWAVATKSTPGESADRVERVDLFSFGEFRGREIIRYNAQGIPLERDRFDMNEELEYTERYRYRTDSTLRAVERCDSEKDCILVLFGLPENSWPEQIEGPEFQLLREFDHLGRPIYTRRSSPGSTTIREEWIVYEEGRVRERTVREEGQTIVFEYRDGLVVAETAQEGTRRLFEIERQYDDERRLIREQRNERNKRATTTWEYDPDGGYMMERFENGVITLQMQRDTAGSGYTTRFQDGEPVVRETFQDGTAVRREIIVDDDVQRVEEL